jgi:hypothetical protein
VLRDVHLALSNDELSAALGGSLAARLSMSAKPTLSCSVAHLRVLKEDVIRNRLDRARDDLCDF